MKLIEREIIYGRYHIVNRYRSLIRSVIDPEYRIHQYFIQGKIVKQNQHTMSNTICDHQFIGYSKAFEFGISLTQNDS